MRIVIDLQGAQSGSRHRGIGRYSLALAQAMVRNRGKHEVIIALNGLFHETIEPIRATFEGILPQENIRVWHAPGPVYYHDSANSWRREAAELIRETFLASLQPDMLHIASLFEGWDDNSVHSIGKTLGKLPTAVTFYDVIPLIQSDVYLTPHPEFEEYYREKLGFLKRADLFLAISESSRQESLDYLNVTTEQAVNIGSAVDDQFKPVCISREDEQQLRNRFGLARRFLMYSGATDERKNHLRLIKAFSLLPDHLRENLQLAIVGGLPGNHQEKFEAYAKFCGLNDADVVITGRVSDTEMVRLYNLCELFVFPSWHEGFGLPALEAMSCGTPVIGSNTTSLPEVIGREYALFDPFSETAIAQKIVEVLTNDHLRADLAVHGLEQAKKFSWDNSAKKAIAAFECWYEKKNVNAKSVVSTDTSEAWLIEQIAKLSNPPEHDHDWLMIAQAIGQNYPTASQKQLLVDVSELVNRDAKTGIQRVTRSILRALLSNSPDGYRVEPVYATPNAEEGYRYARRFKQRFTDCPDLEAVDDVVDAYNGDLFFGLDFAPVVVMANADYYQKLRLNGVKVYFLVHDLLPVLMPEVFDDGVVKAHIGWLGTLAQADGVVCVSRTVAQEYKEILDVLGTQRLRPFKIGWSHNAANVEGSLPTKGLPSDADHILSTLSLRPSFLMVGTIEPRKGHLQTLGAFEQLWNQGIDVNLIIVGQRGWNVDLLVDLLRIHNERNRRLFWLNGISDEFLEKIYAASTCLIAASLGEGFGLPLIEAALYKLPIIARDIPVFREVAGVNAYYFSGLEAADLASLIKDWLVIEKAGMAPQSETMPWLNWAQSTQRLLDVILNDNWMTRWMPDGVFRYFGSDPRLLYGVGRKYGLTVRTTGTSGHLFYGSYLSLPAGRYQIRIQGLVKSLGTPQAYVDVAIQKGAELLCSQILAVLPDTGLIADIEVCLKTAVVDFEARVWVAADSDLSVSKLEIVPQSL